MSTDADWKKRSRMAEDEDQRAERLLKNKVRMQHQREEGRVLNTLADEFDLKKPLPFRSFVSTATSYWYELPHHLTALPKACTL